MLQTFCHTHNCKRSSCKAMKNPQSSHTFNIYLNLFTNRALYWNVIRVCRQWVRLSQRKTLSHTYEGTGSRRDSLTHALDEQLSVEWMGCCVWDGHSVFYNKHGLVTFSLIYYLMYESKAKPKNTPVWLWSFNLKVNSERDMQSCDTNKPWWTGYMLIFEHWVI